MCGVDDVKIALSHCLAAKLTHKIIFFSRFDVTGVHPKTKVPGSFTQIPYDKNSMLELVRTALLFIV